MLMMDVCSPRCPCDNYYQLCQGKNQQIVETPWLSLTSELLLLTKQKTWKLDSELQWFATVSRPLFDCFFALRAADLLSIQQKHANRGIEIRFSALGTVLYLPKKVF